MKDPINKTEKQYPIAGFAPGAYWHKACVTCSQEFLGDKRAVQCESCAIEMVNTKVKVNDEGGVEIDELKSYEEIITTELEKCKKSPYYFATTYITIGGVPFRTYMTEQEFNDLIKNYKK